MQLGARSGVVVVGFVAACLVAAGDARAQSVVEVDTAHTVFYEAPTKTHMFVYSPSADVQAAPWAWLDVRGGWEADGVSGASVSPITRPRACAARPATTSS